MKAFLAALILIGIVDWTSSNISLYQLREFNSIQSCYLRFSSISITYLEIRICARGGRGSRRFQRFKINSAPGGRLVKNNAAPNSNMPTINSTPIESCQNLIERPKG